MSDDIRAALEAAMGGEAAPVEAAQEAVQSAEGAEVAAETQTAAQRDEKGRFAKADTSAHTEATEPASPADTAEPAQQTTRVPASLPAALKAEFATLPEPWRKAILAQEESVQTAKAEWGKKGERLNRYEEIIAPRREKFQLQGLDEFTAVQTLFAAQDLLERSPLEGLSYLARSYGVDLRQLVPQTSGVQQAPGQAPQGPGLDILQHPALQGLAQQVQTLTQTFEQQQAAAQAQQTAAATAQIEAFRSDPKNLYFDNVRNEVAGLLRSGQAQSLEQAYEAAIWASPEIRPLLIKEQQAQAAAANAQAQQQAQAARSRQAGVSVTGAPGATAQVAAGSTGNLRADLEAAAATLGARVG